MSTMKHVSTLKAARRIFREWCMEHGAVVDVEMAADLVRRIKTAIDAESAALTADAEITRLRTALEIIAGRRQCIDNLLSNVEIACLALDTQLVRHERHLGRMG
jgi:hypothetical protein